MPAPHRPFESKDVTLASGHKLHYHEWPGEGPNLILLHGSHGYGLTYEWVAGYLGNRFHIYALDQRGQGDSDKPNGTYAAEEFAQDLHEFMQALGIGQAVIGGHSLGGRVSQVFAASHPDECRGMILIGGLHLSNFFQDRDNGARVLQAVCAAFSAPMEFPSREEALAYIRKSRPRDTEESHLHRLEHNMSRDGDTYRFKYDNVRVAQSLSHQNDDLRPDTPLVQAPVVIMRSTRGSELTTTAQAEEMAKLWKHGSVVDVEGDYLLYVTAPEALAKAIETFIDTKVTSAANV